MQDHKSGFEGRVSMNTDFVNLTTENLVNEHHAALSAAKSPIQVLTQSDNGFQTG